MRIDAEPSQCMPPPYTEIHSVTYYSSYLVSIPKFILHL